MTTKRERKALAEKVRAAADYVDRVGLFKGWFWDKSEGPLVASSGTAVKTGVKCCTLGALEGHGVPVFDPDSPAHADDLGAYLREVHPRLEAAYLRGDKPVASIPEWNDRPSRRKKDVVELLRGFADKLEAEQA